MQGWKLRGCKSAAGKPVFTQDLWVALDQARLLDVPLTYVKGHSGDPDNDRVDRIAVSFSRGLGPDLQTTSEAADEPAPAPLQQLLSRLELADRLAAGGFTLQVTELAQLVEQPMRQLEERKEPWIWRDWLVEPLQGQRWRLQRREAGSGEP